MFGTVLVSCYKCKFGLDELMKEVAMLDRLVKEKQKLDYFLWLVQIQWKGSVKDYAMKLGVSEATFYRRIATLKQCGITLYYDKVIGCYCLEHPIEEGFLFEDK